LLGQDDDLYVMASTTGYGFVVTLNDLYTRQKAGKVVITLSSGGVALPPLPITDLASDLLAVVSMTGRLLIFPLAQLPRLPRGKGYKLITAPAEPEEAPTATIAALTCLPAHQPLTLYCGQRHLTLKSSDIVRYTSARGQRGTKLPRGFQRVDRLGGPEPQTPVTL
jgi:topoisomerase-4 subunit A